MKVFVTDGGGRAALAVTRSLGQAGYEVLVGEKYAPALAQRSRYCQRPVVYPDPAFAGDEFTAWVERFVREEQVDILLPIGDICMFLLTAARERFGRCRIPFPDRAVIGRAADKVDMTQTAMRIGVPVPRSIVVTAADAVPVAQLEFPLVIKPRQSRSWTRTGWASSTVSFADDIAALHADLTARPEHDFPVLLQERIVGPGTGVFACMRDGQPVALFSHRRIRERPPWAGVSVLCESVALDPMAQNAAIRLLNEIGWRDGVAMVEFKRDIRDGLPKLMEINGRFWGSLQLAVDAGVDFPRLLAEVAQGAGPRSPAPYTLGVRSRWLWGDVDSLLLTLIGRSRAMGLPLSRWQALRDFFVLFGKNLCYENPRLSDLGPWWYETRERLWLRRHPDATVPLPLSAPPDAPARRPVPAEVMTISAPMPAAPRMVVGIANALDQVGLDAPAWNALLAGNETNSVFQTYEWMAAWCDTYDETFEPLLLTVREGERLLGVLPLMRERAPERAGARLVRFLSDTRADYCDAIAPERKDEVIASAVEALFARDICDVLELRGIPEHSLTTRALLDASAGIGAFMLIRDQTECPTLLVGGHLESAMAILGKESLRRPVKHFARQGRLVIRDLRAADEIAPYLDAFFVQHIGRRATTRSPSLFLDPANVRFYRRLVPGLSAAGWNLFTVVELDDQPIAFHYGFDYDNGVIWYKPSFAVSQAKHSPGLVLVSHLLEYVIEHQRRELDFTVGNEAFKRRFTNHTRMVRTVNVFRRPIDFAVESWRGTASRTIKGLTEQMG